MLYVFFWRGYRSRDVSRLRDDPNWKAVEPPADAIGVARELFGTKDRPSGPAPLSPIPPAKARPGVER